MTELDLVKRYILFDRFTPTSPANRNQSGSPNQEDFWKIGISMLERLLNIGLQPQNLQISAYVSH